MAHVNELALPPDWVTPSSRKSPRLSAFDYGDDGMYFITVCTYQRACVLGAIVDDAVGLFRAGEIVDACWRDIPRHFPGVQLDEYVVMPNHLHGIIAIDSASNRQISDTSRPSISNIVGRFKGASSREIHRTADCGTGRTWQRTFYDHVIRTERALGDIRQYIEGNPLRWEHDAENPGVGRGRQES